MTTVEKIRARLTEVFVLTDEYLQVPKKKELPSAKNLRGTYEEMYSNWKNKMVEAAGRDDVYSSFMNLLSLQWMFHEITDTHAKLLLTAHCPYTQKKEWWRIPGLYERNSYAFEFLFLPDSKEPFCIYKDGQNDGVAARFNYYPKEDISVTILSNQDCDVWDMTRHGETASLWRYFFRYLGCHRNYLLNTAVMWCAVLIMPYFLKELAGGPLPRWVLRFYP